jgi:hypothetical protein
MKNILLFLMVSSLIACTKHADVALKEKETTVSKNSSEYDKAEFLFSKINENYKPNYLEETNFKAKVKRDKPQDYFTNEGNKMYFELLSLAESNRNADIATLEANHLRIQDKLKSAVNLPDYQRLVIASGSKLIARHLINAETDKEKELLFFYTKNLVEEQCTNYYLLYESFSKIRNESNKNEISSLVKKTLSIEVPQNSSFNPTISTPSTQIFKESTEKGYQYKGLYKKRLQEFL